MPVEAALAFSRPEDVVPGDPGRGVGRARTLPPDALHDGDAFAHHRVTIRDCTDGSPPDLAEHGFAHVDLTGVAGLPAVFAAARAAGTVTDQQARAVRRALTGAVLPLSGGRRLKLLFIAPEGFIMRRGGPNGLRVTDSATAQGMNNHDAAVSVHADQDVCGTPVRQLLRGMAPWLFHHRSPHRSNPRSPLHLLNIWVPLQQPTRPLALMDIRSLDRRAHQLQYGLETDGFLDRPADQRVNDIWTFLHSPDQDWYFTADSGPDRAYVFQTLSTPHGAFVLPGEDRAEHRYCRLQAARQAVADGKTGRLKQILAEPFPDSSAPVTPALTAAIARMEACLGAARMEEAWLAEAAAAMDGVVRKSIEMRAVGLVTPRWWPKHG